MTRQLDSTAFAALTKLLDKLTDKQETHQDVQALQQIKAFCKYSDENITWISGMLLHRLKEDHAQVPRGPQFAISTASVQLVSFASAGFLEVSLKTHASNCPSAAPVAPLDMNFRPSVHTLCL